MIKTKLLPHQVNSWGNEAITNATLYFILTSMMTSEDVMKKTINSLRAGSWPHSPFQERKVCVLRTKIRY